MNNFFEVTSLFLQKEPFNLIAYLTVSFIFIIIYHLALNFGSEFNLFLTIGFFALGAFLGVLFNVYFGLLAAIILSFIFISGPRKDL